MAVPRSQQEPNRVLSSLKWKILVVLLIVVGVSVQGWAAGQWANNFDSDEATFGLMARHVLRGEVPTFVYGNRYLGSTEAILAAPFLHLFGNHVFVFRLSTIMLFALFLSLNALLVTKWFGRHAALYTLLFLIFPGWRILWWTFRPIGPYALMFVLGTFILLLGTWLLRKPSFQPVGLGLLGFVTGIALWTHQMSIPYILAIVVAFLLQSPEWKALYAKGAKWSSGMMGKAAVLLPPLFIVTLVALFVLSFFSSSCIPPQPFALARTISRLGLILIAGALVVALFAFSGRRQSLVGGGIVITFGLVLGTAPLWVNTFLTGIAPLPALWPSCPTGIPERIGLLTSELLPGLFGLPTMAEIQDIPFAQLILASGIAVLVCAAVVSFIWHRRQTLSSLLTLFPLSRLEPVIVLALLLTVPLSLAALGSNTVDVLSIRYLLVTWQASAIILGIFIARVGRHSLVIAILFVALWVYQLGISNLRDVHQFWETRYGRFAAAATTPLEETLRDAQITAGYSDYWTAYALDFLLEERIILTPYNGIDRYPAYTAYVLAQPKVAVILPGNLVPQETATIQEVQQVLSGFIGAGPAFSQFQMDIANRHLQQRIRVGRWDVWILEN